MDVKGEVSEWQEEVGCGFAHWKELWVEFVELDWLGWVLSMVIWLWGVSAWIFAFLNQHWD